MRTRHVSSKDGCEKHGRLSIDAERGQTTIAAIAVVLLICLIGMALMTLADAMVHRARARTAADAVALAAASDDPASASDLITWYRNDGVSIVDHGSYTSARSGPSQGLAWAERALATDQPAPALVAIVARAAQLTGAEFEGIRWNVTSVELPTASADQMRLVAAELGLCEVPDVGEASGGTVFELC